ncbi:MAG: response regulator [Deltaproteobacteria bacterium]|nr:response regulator [Deltaproteobacteria bacterium]
MANNTVLIVDDEKRNIKLLKAYLMTGQYKILEALNGEEALKMMDDFHPDIVLLDVMMPGIDGFEVCKRLKQDDKTQMVPVIMVTALMEKEYRIKALEAGADDFLSKPVDRTEVLVRVKSLLRIKSYHDDLRESYKEIAVKNKRLEELDKMKEGLTHMVIHDLNNPFMAISGSLELLLMDRELFPQSQAQALEQCIDYCKDIRRLIQGLLDIHKMEKGKLQPNRKLTDPVALIDEVIGQFLTNIEKKQIELCFPKPKNKISVEMDRELIKRVVANLLNNAIRHTPDTGRIEITVDSPLAEGNLRISVTDSGSGLDPEYHQKIFDKFEQINLKQKGVGSGTSGLGLAFCKLAIEAHGGEIWVESTRENQGCAFRFTIPDQLKMKP